MACADVFVACILNVSRIMQWLMWSAAGHLAGVCVVVSSLSVGGLTWII